MDPRSSNTASLNHLQVSWKHCIVELSILKEQEWDLRPLTYTLPGLI